MDCCRFHVPFKAAGPFGLRCEEELMRTKAFLRPATSCAIALAAIVAAAAVGAPGPAFAAKCGGVSSSPHISANSGVQSGVKSGATAASGSIATTPISSCPSTANTVISAPHAAVPSGGLGGTFTHNGTHHNKEANIQHTMGAHTWTSTNKITATNKWHKS
jgi:hypothetical protein